MPTIIFSQLDELAVRLPHLKAISKHKLMMRAIFMEFNI